VNMCLSTHRFLVFNQDAVELCLKRQKNGEVHH